MIAIVAPQVASWVEVEDLYRSQRRDLIRLAGLLLDGVARGTLIVADDNTGDGMTGPGAATVLRIAFR